MRCESCGAESTQESNFCKQCGAQLGSTEALSASAITVGRLSGLFWAIAVFALVSFTTLFGVTIPLTIFGANSRIITIMLVFGCGGIAAVAGLMIHQLSRLIGTVQNADRALKAGSKPGVRPRPRIEGPPKPISSVTEHTTRNFDQIYREPGRE
jgi:hypothetical protein